MSLGVFLFGYDQGVMSGIITYVGINLHDSLYDLLICTAAVISKTILANPRVQRLVQWSQS